MMMKPTKAILTILIIIISVLSCKKESHKRFVFDESYQNDLGVGESTVTEFREFGINNKSFVDTSFLSDIKCFKVDSTYEVLISYFNSMEFLGLHLIISAKDGSATIEMIGKSDFGGKFWAIDVESIEMKYNIAGTLLQGHIINSDVNFSGSYFNFNGAFKCKIITSDELMYSKDEIKHALIDSNL